MKKLTFTFQMSLQAVLPFGNFVWIAQDSSVSLQKFDSCFDILNQTMYLQSSLLGEKGNQGPPGPQGAEGPRGPKGQHGNQPFSFQYQLT